MSKRTLSRTLSTGVLLALALVFSVGPGPLAPRDADAGEPAARALALTRGLKTRRLASVRFEQADLNEVVRWLRIATGYNIVAIPLAAGVLPGHNIALHPAVGAVLMSASTVVVAINAQLFRRASL